MFLIGGVGRLSLRPVVGVGLAIRLDAPFLFLERHRVNNGETPRSSFQIHFSKHPMPRHDEFFDVYYDIGESLFDRIRSMMDRFYKAKPRTADDLTALKTIRDHVVRAVAAMESIRPESIYRDLEEI